MEAKSIAGGPRAGARRLSGVDSADSPEGKAAEINRQISAGGNSSAAAQIRVPSQGSKRRGPPPETGWYCELEAVSPVGSPVGSVSAAGFRYPPVKPEHQRRKSGGGPRAGSRFDQHQPGWHTSRAASDNVQSWVPAGAPDREIKQSQRGTSGFWKAEYAFPKQPVVPGLTGFNCMENSSIEAVAKFNCSKLRGCQRGNCAGAISILHVQSQRRQRLEAEQSNTVATISSQKALEHDLLPYFDSILSRWKELPVHISPTSYRMVCVGAYCLVRGYPGSTALAAIKSVEGNEVIPGFANIFRNPTGPLAGSIVKRANEELLVRQYIHNLQFQHQCQPVPGGHNDKLTHISKQTMTAKWKTCEQHFLQANPRTPPPGDKRMFQRMWNEQTVIREKTRLANAKCGICSAIDAKFALCRIPPLTADKKRDFLLTEAGQKLHEANHLADRAVMDDAGYMATVNPNIIWCLLIDAATQRNFCLPKKPWRTPKHLGSYPDWNFTLMGVYAFGFGFFPFIAHDSLTFGSNLTWTAIWLVLCSMRDVRGRWPDILHLQMDNCSGDNKNFVTWAIAAWLVASGRVKQVRIFFLMVGHTHIIIDQVFGVITTGLKGIELAVPQDLLDSIDHSLKKNPQYLGSPAVWLHTLWDWKDWCENELQRVPITHLGSGTKINDTDGDYNGMYDMLISQHGEWMASIQYRECCRFPWRPEASSGMRIIKRLPDKPPALAQLRPFSKWGKRGNYTFAGTVVEYQSLLRKLDTNKKMVAYKEAWKTHIDDIRSDPLITPKDHQLVFPHFKLQMPALEFAGADPPAAAAPESGEKPSSATGLTPAEETAWRLRFLGMRTTPFSYDPVIGSGQSTAEFKLARDAFEFGERQCQGSMTNRSAPIFLGNMLLCRTPGSGDGLGVSLYQVDRLEPRGATCWDTDVDVVCTNFFHTPNPDVSGLWGKFKREMKKDAPAIWIKRQDVVVFHVQLFQRVVAKKKIEYLRVDSLRNLSRVCSAEYPMPVHVPLSHADDQHGGAAQKARRKAPAARGKATAKAKSSGKKPAAKRKKRRKEWNSDSAEDDESDAADESEEESEYESEEEEEEQQEESEAEESEAEEDVDVEAGADAECDEEVHAQNSDSGGDIPSPAAPAPAPAMELAGPKPTFEPGTFGFAIMVGEKCFKGFSLPISPYYCEGTEGAPDGKVYVRYFHPPAKLPKGLKNAMGEYTPKTWSCPKYWQDSSFGMYKKLSTGNAADKRKIPDDYFNSNWQRELMDIHHALPLVVPERMRPKVENIMRVERLVLEMKFVMEELLPLAKQYHITA